MVKELERAGITTVLFSALPKIPYSMGTSRIVACPSITCLLGDPRLDHDQERALRVRMLRRGLTALRTAVERPTIFGEGGAPEQAEAMIC
jgi:betaine reductase